jgi:PAS domain S-box-containing protein
MTKRPRPTANERTFAEDEVIVSKTDAKGRIVYANDVFCKVGLYEEDELLGKPHSIVRHPDMPRAVFRLLWDRIQAGEEIFAYVKNMAKSGDCYWVFAHVTPSFAPDGAINGYHSNRRVPDRTAIGRIEPVYRELQAIETANADRGAGMAASGARLTAMLQAHGQSYDEFVFGVGQ